MLRILRSVLVLFIIVLVAALAWRYLGPKGDTGAGTTQESGTELASLPLRFNGHYRTDNGEVIRLMRFFPEGNVVLINGTKDVEKGLHQYLVKETRGNPGMGLHNVPVTVRADSLFFTVRPERGEIDFAGKVMTSTLLRFERYSHINGKRDLFEYIFYPDSAASGQ